MDALIKSMRRGCTQLEDRAALREIFRSVINDGLQHLRPSPIDGSVRLEPADSGSSPSLFNSGGVDADLEDTQLSLNAFGQHSLIFGLKLPLSKVR
jgi:hypothetical protein